MTTIDHAQHIVEHPEFYVGAPKPAPVAPAVPRQETPADVLAAPRAVHRIVDGQPVCDGDQGSYCHLHPDCDHDFWPCGCDYNPHDTCWMLWWLDGNLRDTCTDETGDRALEDGSFPDGEFDWEWEHEYVIWWYLDEATPESAAA